ncbi:hypothetical protein [Phytoactinopolyspora mesophila]|uniref:Uncharacterized protein n=1 Tax=Phytoactinopolyspora mesophila TaxID=2650750 RepID=A0A7K3LY00_9ACTN|nr:hypothetical protein [Phytoactinopolyspora mesophila]NDL55885.1 hypothetical protein [Phytoactinopolyspora mesophila]
MNAEKGLSFVPDACTLPTAEQLLREAEFRSLFGSAVREIQRSSATSLTLVLDGDPPTEETARDLAAREGQCCSFFTFTFRHRRDARASTQDLLEMAITVPDGRAAVLDGVQQLAARSMGRDGAV